MLVMGMVRPSKDGARTAIQNDDKEAKDSNTRKASNPSDKVASNEIQDKNNNKDLLSKESRLNDEEPQIFLSKLI